MTHKETAISLVEKYWDLLIIIPNVRKRFLEAKACAIIAVDEIIEQFPEKRIDRTENYQWGLLPHPSYEYWKEVKKQIELL